ncbi:RAMP superfamily CRISPR-associated protein [candidate division NPL-UPA2 bacterium]|nr:RAMP superfamily CRISPR-associated protein [candidate division NPL-UPA2 bacterium]
MISKFKPFAYVPTKRPTKRGYIPHDKFDNLSGKLYFEIEVIGPYLFVGSGRYEFKEEGGQTIVYFTFFKSNGRPAIPGSSIKGSMRSILEAISNSCERGRCQTKGKNPQLCPACSIFGASGYSGRASFADAPLISGELKIEKIGELFRPRREWERGARKFYQERQFKPLRDIKPEPNFRLVEAVPKGARFSSILSFFNLSEEELCLIFHALGLKDDLFPKLGGAKPRGFGTIRFNPRKLMIRRNPWEDFQEKEGEELEDFITNILKLPCPLLDAESYKTLIAKINKDKSTYYPERNY